MRIAAVLILTTPPRQARTFDPPPGFSLDSAITCLALAVNEIERYPDYAASRAEWMVSFSRLIAVKSSETELAAFGSRLARELASLRNPMIDQGILATPEEADEILTGTGKMCWFHALATEGGPFHDP